MKTKLLKSAAAPALVTSLCAGALAAPPPTSPYATDVANIYVQDATSDAMGNLNMVLCIVNGMNPGAMLTAKGVLNASTGVTEVQYIALVDQNKCNTHGRASTSNSTAGASGATSTPDYITAIVDVTRGSGASDPMVGKVWMSLVSNSSNNTPVNTSVFARLSATSDPTTAPPYGVLRVDYVGFPTGANLSTTPVMFNGYVDANGPLVNYLETGANSSDSEVGLNAQSTTAGSGTIQTLDQSVNPAVTVTYKVAYNASAYARNAGGADICFDRSSANAQESVWTYGTYDATTGARVDQAHPGFPIAGTASGISGMTNGTTLYGFASYWGINFGGLDQNVVAAAPDGQLTMVTNITDQRPNNSTAYQLYKNGGNLTRWSRNAATLAAIDGIPFQYGGDGCKLVNGSGSGTASPSGLSTCATTATSDFENWVMQWDATLVVNHGGTPTTGNFKVVGMQSCPSNSPCVITTFATPAPVVQGFMHTAIQGWSDALGGNITIPMPPGDTTTSGTTLHSGTDTVYYYTQQTVLPGSASLSLYCLNQCPTASSLSQFVSNQTQTPFASNTGTQFGSGSSEVAYTFGASGLLDGTSTVVEASGALPAGQWQNGIMTGRLYTTDLANSGSNPCPDVSGTTPWAYCEPATAPSTYYTYQTGPNQWNQTTWLTANGSPVPFDAPINVNFTVPSDSSFIAQYGTTWAGKAIQLQFNGFGNLQGIPGNCVDGQTNLPVDCSASGSRYVPAFALADGTQITIGTESVLTRALNAELRLKQIACPSGLSTSSVTTGLPTAQPHNPALSSDSYYIGTAPAVTGNPAVIDGVLQ